jgi:hypothetical protein
MWASVMTSLSKYDGKGRLVGEGWLCHGEGTIAEAAVSKEKKYRLKHGWIAATAYVMNRA